ncbi:hypothetical protein ABZ379_49550 [Streptomyces canus]|uniref:hypothetical protein n=1 Tax=Streptomyces canus TaxID=58343 RepID=UPI0033BFF0BA
MSEAITTATELTSQYTTQVTDDLERNLKEQDRITSEIEALQTKLGDLKRDHTVLMIMQQALGEASAAAVLHDATQVPASRMPRKAADSTTPTRKRTSDASQPTLVSLVRAYLTSQKEPRSAAEVTTALSQQHPGRPIKATVVRTTLEGLVAKSLAHRTKQGASVSYAAQSASEPTPDARGAESA